MKSSKNFVIAALAVLSATTSVLAWKNYWKAAQLEAAALGAEDAATLRQRLAEAEKRRRDLESRLMAGDSAGAGNAEGAPLNRPAGGEMGPGRGRGGRGGPRGEEFQAAMDRPEMQRLMALQQKAALDGRYGTLFKSLNLSPEKLSAFKNLLAEKEATMMDTMRAAREQGIDPRSDPEAFKKLMATTQAETNAAIKAAIGDAAFAEYQNYETTAPQRAVVSQLQQALSYSEPLTTAQSEQLVQLLAANSAPAGTATGVSPEGAAGGRGGPFGGGPGGRTVAITTETITQAQTVLSSTQLQALQELQTLQQAQRQAQQLMRANGAGGATGTTRGSGGE